ncbi:MAG: glycine betaine/L-proline ABC transporter ATP-binding protein [Mangrovibacterium sp.]
MSKLDVGVKPKIEVKNLSLIFGKKKEEALAMLEQGKSKAEILKKTKCIVGVNRANLHINEGEFFVIMGLSGSGKSTLLRCLNRLIEPTDGDVIVNDLNITRESNKMLIDTRRKQMSMVFQSFALLPHRTILDNVAFGLEIRGEEKTVRLKRAQEAVENVGLKGFEAKFPHELSGGMQQRVGIARAIANNPEILLMDEAFSALDPLIRVDMQDEMLEIQSRLKKTIVFITHDLDEAIKLGDRIAIMKDGVIEQIGTPEDILTNPASDYVEAFVERVDRKTVIKAETLMRTKFPYCKLGIDGPRTVIRKLSNLGVEMLPVLDSEKRFMGWVWLNDAIEAKKQGINSIEGLIYTEVPTVTKEQTVEEMLPLITGLRSPLPVIEHETGKMLGIVTQTALIIESTPYDKEEIIGLKEQAIEQTTETSQENEALANSTDDENEITRSTKHNYLDVK